MTGRTEAACLENLKMCISETVAMRHPNPMKHIACMLVAVANPNFQETLDPTVEYVQRHNLQVRLTAALAQAGYLEGQPEPPDLLDFWHRTSAMIHKCELRDGAPTVARMTTRAGAIDQR